MSDNEKIKNYKEINKKLWNNRLSEHLKSDFYKMNNFLSGESSLNEIELELLKDIKNKSILHLQCHFGQDTISLSRMGANVTGVDFSEKSIIKAKELAIHLKQNTIFICSDIYDLPEMLDQKFDIIFTTYGTICWLPDLNAWGKLINKFLKPEGRLVFVEFHPFVWMFDEHFQKIKYHYNNTNPIVEVEYGTYANPNADITNDCITWNHGVGEVIESLISNGLVLESLKEYDFAPYPFVNNSIEDKPGKYTIKNFENKAPLVYSILAKKGSDGESIGLEK